MRFETTNCGIEPFAANRGDQFNLSTRQWNDFPQIQCDKSYITRNWELQWKFLGPQRILGRRRVDYRWESNRCEADDATIYQLIVAR